jgi:glycosyltransferase involved in cell wall biosynthesis
VQRALDTRLEREVIRRADAIVAVTSPIGDDVQRRFGRRAELITNGFDPDEVRDGGDDDFLVDPQRFSFAHTGSMGFTGASTRHLVEALGLLHDEAPQFTNGLEFVFAGLLSTDEAELLGTRRLAEIVRCVGSLERSDVLRLQRAADALLVVTEGAKRPSVATGKLFEYLATSKPILVLGEGTEAARIVVASGRGVATSANDPRAISEAIRRTVQDGRRSLDDRQGLERYSWPQLAAQYAAVIEEVSR